MLIGSSVVGTPTPALATIRSTGPSAPASSATARRSRGRSDDVGHGDGRDPAILPDLSGQLLQRIPAPGDQADPRARDLAKVLASDRPMPLDAPVITATWPA